MRAVLLSSRPNGIGEVVAVARQAVRVELAEDAAARVAAAERAVRDAAARGEAIYGVTRGLGPKSDVPVGGGDVSALQHRIVAARAVAAGTPLPDELLRAALFVRVAGIARGGSGASLRLLRALVAALNDGTPLPATGGVGSLGDSDLVLLATAFQPLLPADGLGPKDGLALISANALSVAHGALVLVDVERLLEAAADATALAFAGFASSLEPIDERVAAAHPLPGQAEAASALRERLGAPDAAGAAAERRLQDPFSFRCAPQVLGAALAAAAAARAVVEAELGSAADNPLVTADGELLHNGNFDAIALAFAFDALALALHHVVAVSAARTARLLEPRTSGLPQSLSAVGADRAGLVPLQKVAAAAAATVRHLAHPASLDVPAVSDGIEDHAAQAPLAVAQVAELLVQARLVLAVELLVAAQAVDLRDGPGTLAPATAAVYDLVRARSARLDDDRALGGELQAIVALLGER